MTSIHALFTAAATIVCLSASQHTLAQTQPTKGASPSACKVKDPEIQGRYVGECNVMGLAHGTGTAQGAAAAYTGQFKDGQKSGFGVKAWTRTGDRYVGQFKADFRDGVGTYAWGEKSGLLGYQYTGQYAQDKRQGQGIFDWPNGESYAGKWANDAQLDGFTPTQILQGQTADAQAGRVRKP